MTKTKDIPVYKNGKIVEGFFQVQPHQSVCIHLFLGELRYTDLTTDVVCPACVVSQERSVGNIVGNSSS